MSGLGFGSAGKQHTLTAVCEGRPVASAGWLLRDMAFDGSPRRTAELSSVLVYPACRDRGIVRTVISVALEHARAAGAETMVLLSRPDLVPFYTQLGWSGVSVVHWRPPPAR
ncbi:GNAT family N-acetyltransferase [Streptomyces sp. FR-108]|uniref:GNAT family N-acetyltransferase n=1 Tax=Streptomyces sp. FR-108 TaxID=3416665 RepID=UPI003CFA062C